MKKWTIPLATAMLLTGLSFAEETPPKVYSSINRYLRQTAPQRERLKRGLPPVSTDDIRTLRLRGLMSPPGDPLASRNIIIHSVCPSGDNGCAIDSWIQPKERKENVKEDVARNKKFTENCVKNLAPSLNAFFATPSTGADKIDAALKAANIPLPSWEAVLKFQRSLTLDSTGRSRSEVLKNNLYHFCENDTIAQDLASPYLALLQTKKELDQKILKTYTEQGKTTPPELKALRDELNKGITILKLANEKARSPSLYELGPLLNKTIRPTNPNVAP